MAWTNNFREKINIFNWPLSERWISECAKSKWRDKDTKKLEKDTSIHEIDDMRSNTLTNRLIECKRTKRQRARQSWQCFNWRMHISVRFTRDQRNIKFWVDHSDDWNRINSFFPLLSFSHCRRSNKGARRWPANNSIVTAQQKATRASTEWKLRHSEPRHSRFAYLCHQKWILQAHQNQQIICTSLNHCRMVECDQSNIANQIDRYVFGQSIHDTRTRVHSGQFYRRNGCARFRLSESDKMQFLQIRSVRFSSASRRSLHYGVEHYQWENLCDFMVLVCPNGDRFDRCIHLAIGYFDALRVSEKIWWIWVTQNENRKQKIPMKSFRITSFFAFRFSSVGFNKFVFSTISFRRINTQDLIVITAHITFADWLFLYYLGKNMDSFLFASLLGDLANEFRNHYSQEHRRLLRDVVSVEDNEKELNIDTIDGEDVVDLRRKQ